MREEDWQKLEERIRQRAHEIWEREGRPDGRDRDHWELARQEIAIQDNLDETLEPNPAGDAYDTAARTEPVEPLLAVESQGEHFGPAGQDDVQPVPARRTKARRGKGDAG